MYGIQVNELIQFYKHNQIDFSKILRVMNPGFKLAGYSKTDLIEIFRVVDDKTITSYNSNEKLMFLLLTGLSFINNRIEEYSNKLSYICIYTFFKKKLDYYEKLNKEKKPIKKKHSDNDIKNLIYILYKCHSEKRNLFKKFQQLYTFDGNGACIKEEYHRYQIRSFERMSTVFKKDRSNNKLKIPRNLFIKKIILNLSFCLTINDYIIVTSPRWISNTKLDAWGFECIFDDKLVDKLPTQILEYLKKRLIEQKEKERLQIKEPGYFKLYVNLSNYINSNSQLEEHIIIGFSNAMRYIIDIQTDQGTIHGLCDIRVIRFGNKTSFTHKQIELLFSAGKKIESYLSKN